MVNMVMRFVVSAALVLAASQDPIKTLPDNYKVVLDNDYVRVVKVHYDAGAVLPDHVHPAGNTIYVYLNESDGVVFKHSGDNNRAVTRPPVKPGAVRIATGPEEHHTVTNESKKPSDFLRIFLKTEGDTSRSTRRLPPDEASFDFLIRQCQGPLEGGPGVFCSPQSSNKFAARLPKISVQSR